MQRIKSVLAPMPWSIDGFFNKRMVFYIGRLSGLNILLFWRGNYQKSKNNINLLWNSLSFLTLIL
jgi:hypothetical protein